MSGPDLFSIIKERVDIEDAARFFGMQPVRGEWYLCPFHREKTPSFHFRNRRFHCFGCGAGGDVLDLAARHLNVAPLEAVKELNRAFGLGLDMDAPVDAEALKKAREAQRERLAFREWKDGVRTVLAHRFATLYQKRKAMQPATPDDLTDEYAAIVKELDVLEYYLDIANSRDEHELRETVEVLNRVVRKIKERGAALLGGGGSN